ncbi:YitT family protein [Maritimibacter sp. DP1N21-5]|uniref:YitT family protein n=1 Tax=Maritimibacter sp. DP1N21-5 TaxID=2836867 RepID=UPI001C460343|nr:YitT family protein [Maritimibacter sp. DP1N21-5]MBV7409884.1 YitT family protein [Maritimibacter sp. DP1N21-5]
MAFLSSQSDRHSLIEDAFAFLTGAALMALSVQFLQSAGLFTGQVAGASLILSYLSGYSFGVVFFVLNLPFYAFSLLRMGLRFTLKSFGAVLLMAVVANAMSRHMVIEVAHPAAAAVLAGLIAGAGLLVLFRHGASMGGIGMMALFLQDNLGIRAGLVQLGFDACIFVIALFFFPFPLVIWSLLGAAVLNIVITLNHRRDRYIATS